MADHLYVLHFALESVLHAVYTTYRSISGSRFYGLKFSRIQEL